MVRKAFFVTGVFVLSLCGCARKEVQPPVIPNLPIETAASSEGGDRLAAAETTAPPPANTPTPEPLPTDTPTPEPSPTDTPTPEPSPTDTPTPEPSPTDTPIPKSYTLEIIKETAELSADALILDDVPKLGEHKGRITGALSCPDPGAYRIVIIISAKDGWNYVKPAMANYLTNISPDGGFSAVFYTDTLADFETPVISLYFVDKGYEQEFATVWGEQYAIADDSIDILKKNCKLAAVIYR